MRRGLLGLASIINVPSVLPLISDGDLTELGAHLVDLALASYAARNIKLLNAKKKFLREPNSRAVVKC
jgi:hypothetical protein